MILIGLNHPFIIGQRIYARLRADIIILLKAGHTGIQIANTAEKQPVIF